ncbi:hypothetical protein [Thalassotalea ganghwensis]
MVENIEFYIVFALQLVIVSIVLPNKIFNRITYVVNNFPPEKYPKLYPNTQLQQQVKEHTYIKSNRYIFATGLVLLLGILYWDVNNVGKVNEMLPIGFFLLQMYPLMILECKERKYFNAMKKASNLAKRNSILAPRRLFDFVSPYLALVTVLALGGGVAIDVMVNQGAETYLFGVSQDTFFRSVMLILCNLMFLVVIYFNLYGKKLDPYQDNQDRLVAIQANVRSLFYISIAMSCFFAVREATEDTQFEYLQPAIMSLYCTIISVMSIVSRLNTLKVEHINFDVYKAEVDTKNAEKA